MYVVIQDGWHGDAEGLTRQTEEPGMDFFGCEEESEGRMVGYRDSSVSKNEEHEKAHISYRN